MSAEQNVTEAPLENDRQSGIDRTSGEDHNGSSGGYELDEDGQRIPHGQGQSKSSRRRRRKRKNKGSGDGAAATPAGSDAGESGGVISIPVLPGESIALAQNGAARAQQGQVRSLQGSAQQAPQPGGQAGGPNNAPGGTKRWKKKFRERDRQRPDQVGGGASQQNGTGSNGNGSNGFGGGSHASGGFAQRGAETHQPGNTSGGKRKGGFGQGGGKAQRGPRGFVGPMDHSYRAVNGNVFDAGVSTTEFSAFGGSRGRHHGDSQPIDYSQGRPIPIAPDAPTKIYFFIEDLFFIAKIRETARKLGVKVDFVKNDKDSVAALVSGEVDDLPGLIVFDLNNANAKPLTLIPKLKTKLKKHTSIIGFLSHLQGDLKAKAVEAGCDTVMPRAAFSQNLPNLLRRYGIEEIDEPNYNQ
jgi:hypothetical protein